MHAQLLRSCLTLDRLLSPWDSLGKNTDQASVLPDPGIELVSLLSLALAGEFFTTSTTWEVLAKLHIQTLSRQKGGTFLELLPIVFSIRYQASI